MRRKIIKQAGQAYTVTLPIEWVRSNGLKAGSEVEIKTNEKSILISTDSHAESKKVIVDFTGLHERTIMNTISALYGQGADEIKITSKENIGEAVRKAINNIMGFALVSESKGEYIIKEINSGDYRHLDEIFKRVFQIIIAFYDSAINDIFGDEKESLASISLRDIEVNRLCLYLQRAINKSSYDDVVKSRAIFTYSFALEKISDEIERLWRTNIKYMPKKPKELKMLAQMSCDGFGKAFEVFYQYSPHLMEELYSIREKVREKSSLIKSTDSNVLRMVRHIVKIVEDSADLNHLAIMIKG